VALAAAAAAATVAVAAAAAAAAAAATNVHNKILTNQRGNQTTKREREGKTTQRDKREEKWGHEKEARTILGVQGDSKGGRERGREGGQPSK